MPTNYKVTKRNGETEKINLEKIHRVIEWAAEGLNNVSVSQVEMNSHIQFFDGIKTVAIHETIIKAAADLISAETPDYQYLAANLVVFHLRKKAYGRFTPPTLIDQLTKLTQLGKYDKHILEDYSVGELAYLDEYIDHDRDLKFAYAGIKQLEGKYLVQNRITDELYETPQFAYMLIAMCLFAEYPIENRIKYVTEYYDAISLFKLSLPTPIMGGVRTPTRQFSSCVTVESGDSLDSINATSGSIVKYISQRAGIGINAGRLRAIGSEIRGGEVFHTGVIPFYKHFQTAVKSCSQGGLRGGAATVFYPIWHYECEELLVLKNNRGIESNRVRHLDYGVQLCKLFYQRLQTKGNISLFSPSDVPGLYDAFFADNAEFERLYIAAEANERIRRKTIPAIELFSSLMQERASTGRIYIQNVDHCNSHSPFDPSVAPIRQSNLCLEIAIPTKPLDHIHDENGEIGLCTLIALNLGEINEMDDMEKLTDLAVRSLDELLDYQDYPIPAAQNAGINRRTLGIGFINYAYALASRGFKYSDESGNLYTHNIAESLQYYSLRASMNLAKEKGQCHWFDETRYSQGILPIDNYKAAVDKIGNFELLHDWETLRSDIVKFGLRNSTLTCQMPAETSAQVSNSTNGIEPPRGLVSVKASKDGILKQVVPEIEKYRDNYELLWDIPNNTGYLQKVALMQKFFDQSLSANTNYDPSRFEDNKVPMTKLLKDLMLAYSMGIKTLYYHNTRDGATSEDVVKDDGGCGSGGCKI